MRDFVNEWRQEGRLFVWRYRAPRSGYRGWHFTGDPDGCRSLRNLLDCMMGGSARHRTLRLSPVTTAVQDVPGSLGPLDRTFLRLRIEYCPDGRDLALHPNADLLTMTVGSHMLRKLTAALTSVETGDGDFGLNPSDDRGTETWWFWWMPRSDHQTVTNRNAR
jgi:hypothetical protein